MQRYSPTAITFHGGPYKPKQSIPTVMVSDPNGEFVRYADVEDAPGGQEYYLLANNYVRETLRLREEVAELKRLNIVLHDMLRQQNADNYACNKYNYAHNRGDEE